MGLFLRAVSPPARQNKRPSVNGFSNWMQSIVDGIGGELVAAGIELELDLERKHRDNERLP